MALWRERVLRRRLLMDNARKRTHVLLMPRDLIHREVLDPNDKNTGYVRDLLIDEVDWKVRFLHATHGGFLGLDEHHFLIPIEAVSYVGGLREDRAEQGAGTREPGARPQYSSAP
jgi:PRC-barrel domain